MSDDLMIFNDVVLDGIELAAGSAGPLRLLTSIVNLGLAVISLNEAKKFYDDAANNLTTIYNDTQNCINDVKGISNKTDDNLKQLDKVEKQIEDNNSALTKLNKTVHDGLDNTERHLKTFDSKIKDIAGKLNDSTNAILDSIEGAKVYIIEQMHDSRTEKILADLSSYLEFITHEAKQMQSLPLHMRIAKIKKDRGFIDFLTATRNADNSMLELLTKIIDHDIAIPKDKNDKLSLTMLKLLCHGVDVYLFIVTFLVQQYGILAVDYFNKSDIDNYNDYMHRCAGVYNDFAGTLMTDMTGLVPKIITKVLDKIRDSDFISGNRELKQFVEYNLSKFEQIKIFFNEVEFHSDSEENLITYVNFNSSKIYLPILDWKKDSQVYYAFQYSGNKTTPSSKVSEWTGGYTLDSVANPYITIDHDNSNRTRIIFRKFDEGDPQIVAFLTNSTQSVFYDIDRDLYNAAHEPNVDMAWKNTQIYLNNGANASALFEHYKRAIHVATENNNWPVAHALIKNGANINEVEGNGFTPLYIATDAGYEQFVDELINMKADVNMPTGKDNFHFTALHGAVYKQHTNIVKKLMQVPSINTHSRTTDGFTPLSLAVFNNDEEVIDIFLDKTINEIVDIQSEAEFPPIYFAYRNNNEVVVDKLIDQCANVNIRLYDDKTLLHLAVMYSDLIVVQQLLDSINVTVTDTKGRTPLHYAVMRGNDELTSIILDRKADPNAVDINGTPVIIYAVNLQEDKALAVIKALFSSTIYTLNINATSKETENTILHIACTLGYLSVVKYLLSQKADVNSKNGNSETPLHMAAANGYLDVVQYLLDNNATVNAQNQLSETALHLASKIGHFFIVKSLIEKNSTFTLTSNTEETPMEYAVKGDGNLDMFKYFVEALYKKDFSDKGANKTAIENCAILAVRNFKNSIIEYSFSNKIVSGDAVLKLGAVESLKSGNQDMVAFFLKGDPSWLKPDSESGWTVLYYAIMGKGNCQMVQFIMENHSKFASLTVDDKKYGKTLLHLAIETKKLAIANLLLKNNADFDNADFEDDTQLHYASKYGLNKIVGDLILKVNKSSINKKNKKGKTPLFLGVEGEADIHLIQNLITAGSSFDGDGKISLLDAAIVANKTDVAHRFKNQTIDSTNLHVAASNNNIQLVDLILKEKKVDINLEDSQKRKPIYCAVEGNGTLAMIQHLIDKKADIKRFDVKKCDNLITVAIEKNKLDITKHLIGVNDSDVNAVGVSKKTPLYAAIDVDNPILVKLLLDKDANYSLPGPNGATPIDLAIDNKNNTIYFFAYNYRNKQNQTMLHLMASENKAKVVQKLLERGAYVNVQDKDGNSPLHLAAKNGQLDAVKMMCEMKQKCIHVGMQNAKKRTALDLAKLNNQTKVVDYLEHWHPNSTTNQRARREIVEQFSDPPSSSSAGRASWWVSDFVGSFVSTLGSITNQACQSMLSSSYHESRTASAQSISSLSASVNVHSTLLLLDVLARKFTGQSYVGTNSQSGSPLHARSNSLVIVEQFERMLNRLANETNNQIVFELDSFELFRSIENCFLSGEFSKIDRILLSIARDAFPSDFVDESLLVMSVEELLVEVLFDKKDSSLVETSSVI